MRFHRILTVSLACLAATPALAGDRGVPGANELSVMMYNVENLFDAEHDNGKEDWTYLPKGVSGKSEYCQTVSNPKFKEDCERSNWTDAHVDLKLRQIRTAISASGSEMPDILGLAEIENHNVVGMLADKLGYKSFVVSNSPDSRGIDLALLYRDRAPISFVQSHEHEVVLKGQVLETRNVLEVEFETSAGDKLHVFVNHWPSQANPVENRVAAAKTVQRVIDSRRSSNPHSHFLVMGDFNVVGTDKPNAIETVLTNPKTKNPLSDVREIFNASSKVSAEAKRQTVPGSYFFMKTMEWNTLDRFLVSQSLIDGKGLELVEDSFGVNSHSSLTTSIEVKDPRNPRHGQTINGVPRRYDMHTLEQSRAGFSDHLGIYMKLRLN